jgi:DNA polymerase III subunit beta
MKIRILQENLKTHLSFLQKFIPSRPQLGVLSNILLKAEKDKIVLSATDLFVGVKCEIEAEVENPTNIIIPGEVFKNLILSFSSGEILLELKNNKIIIKNINSQTSLIYQSDEEFPQFPVIKGKNIPITRQELELIDKFNSFSVSSDQTRPILTSLLFNFSPKLQVVGTDGFRLTTLDLDKNIDEKKKLLIPSRAIEEVYRISQQLDAENIEMEVAEKLKQVLFKVNGVSIYVRLIDGEFPPYQKIIPTDFETIIEFDGESLATQLKRAFVFARESSNIIRFEIEQDKLFIISSSPTHGEYRGEISIKNPTKTQNKIAFNGLYLIDFLNKVKPEKLIFKMNELLKPALFKVDDNNDFNYIIMPFRANS